MWDIILAIVIFIFIAATIMQIIYIRVNLAHYSKENAVNLIPRQADDSSKNTIRTYGLNVHMRHSLVIEEIHKINLTPLSLPDITIVICGTDIVSRNITYTTYEVVLVEKNTGCYKLVQDILTHKTRYLLLNSSVHLVHYDNDISEKIKTKLMGNTYVDNALLQSQEVLITVKLDNSFVFKEIEDTRTCHPISLVNFFDFINVAALSGGEEAMDLNSFSNTMYLPYIVLGFST